jgi:probable phosphoglycerate mutase
MLRIVLIRPGATDFDDQGRIQGTLSIPLNDQGRQQIAAAIETLRELNLETLYCAAGEAPQQSAETIGKALKVKVKKIDQLHNLDHGLWQGMQVEEIRRKQSKVFRQWQEQPQTICPPDGETVPDAAERIDVALTKLLKKHKSGGVIGLVLPEPIASVARLRLLNSSLDEIWRASGRPATWEVIETEPANLVLS